MARILRLSVMAAFCCLAAMGQTKTGGIFSYGSTAQLPANCSAGQVYYATDQPVGFTLYLCGSAGWIHMDATAGVAFAPRLATSMNIVFEGDSRTSGYGLTKSAQNTTACRTILDSTCQDWPNQLMGMSALTGRGNTFKNVAVGGAGIENAQGQYTAEVHPLSPAETGKTGLLFLNIGVNNVATKTAAWIENALTTYWAGAKADGWSLVVFTQYDRCDSTLAGDATRRAVNDWIRSLEGTGVYDYMVDEDRLFGDCTNLIYNLADLIHPSAAGSYAIARAVNAALWADGTTTDLTAPMIDMKSIGSFTVSSTHWQTGIPMWQKYSLLFIANGTGSCINGGGCIQVTASDGEITTTNAPAADAVYIQASPWLWGLYLLKARVKVTTACTGSTGLQFHDLGNSMVASDFFAQGLDYDLTGVASNTNFLNISPIDGHEGGTFYIDYVGARLTVSSGTVADTDPGCAFDLFLLLSGTK